MLTITPRTQGWPRRSTASVLFGAAFASLLMFHPTQVVAKGAAATQDRFDRVVIDAGHGGEDEGALGVDGLEEKDLVLDVARRLASRLNGQLEVVLTRTQDVTVSLEERTSAANDARGDLFISIHANSARTPKPRGIETFFASMESTDESAERVAARENRALQRTDPAAPARDPLIALLGDMMASEHLTESNEFARIAQEELARIDRLQSRGVKQAPFVVLMGVQMPATLVEIGFLSNPQEERALHTAERRDLIADALARAVIAFGTRYDERRGVSARLPSRTGRP